MRYLLTLVVLGALGLATPLAAKPSFSCDGVLRAAERAICGDERLSTLDRRMAATYKRALLAQPAQAAKIKRDQVAFLSLRNRCGASRPCIDTRYTDRLAVLERYLPAQGNTRVQAKPGAGSLLADRQAACEGKLTSSQRVICSDKALLALDLDLARVLRSYASRTDARGQRFLEVQQQAWRGFRDSCGAIARCIEGRYRARLFELEGGSGSSSGRTSESGGESASKVVGITPDGKIITELGGGECGFKLTDPVTGIFAFVNEDGSNTKADGSFCPTLKSGVQTADLPPLPSGLDGWSEQVTGDLDGLVGNILTPAEAETLEANAPEDFFDRVAYRLRILNAITE